MKILQTKNHKELSQKAFQIVSNQIKTKPNTTLLLASGKTPKKLYKLLTKEKMDFSKTKIFTLDELYKTDSYKKYFQKHLLNKINIKKSNINLLNGKSKNPKKECQNYESKISKNRPDLAVLGIGINGHIAFNEPGSSKNLKTRLVTLLPKTIKKTKTKQALTIGVSTILKSKKIVLLASGKNKSKAIKDLIKEKQTPKLPASFLKNHKDFTLIIDKSAGSLIN